MLFELEWMGGTAERLFQAHRGDGIDVIPWDTVGVGLSDVERDRLRTVWTQSSHQEWCAAGAFSALLTALLEARAPVDLVGMAGRFVADEMVHVELTARMANAYGGGVPLEVEPHARPVDDGLDDAVERACALAVRVSCVGESFSLPLIASELARSTDPVTRAVLVRIAADEAPHATVGWLVLDWALPRLDARAVERLERVADDAVAALLPALRADPANRALYGHVLETRIRRPLESRGVHLAPTGWPGNREEGGVRESTAG
ncbi:MAG: ferritin-like domain-containing protein [Myxococcales bacterium]|nr:ferritin-like domain-containing protein [Myxococcales bacterium]